MIIVEIATNSTPVRNNFTIVKKWHKTNWTEFTDLATDHFREFDYPTICNNVTDIDTAVEGWTKK